MALLDFIKNRNNGQQQAAAENTQPQKAETAKEMYTREAAQDKANAKPLDTMPADQQAKALAVKERLEKATQHRESNAPAPSPTPSDSASSPQTGRQNMTGQDRAAPALSPTTEQAGKTKSEVPDKSAESPAKSPAPSSDRSQQTMARRPPSWER